MFHLLTKATMHAENLLVDDGSNGQAVETIREGFPQFDIIAPLAFIIKAVYSVNTGAFVIAAQNEEVLRVLYLVRQQKTDGLQRLLAAVDVVPQKQVICSRREAAVLE